MYKAAMHSLSGKCNGKYACADLSDEWDCQCEEDEITCDCIVAGSCNKIEGCISTTDVVGGFIRCPDQRIPFGNFGRINFHRLNNVSECNDIGFPECDSTACYHTNISTCTVNECSPSNVICMSFCDDKEKCNGVFQCRDNNYILFSQF